MSPSLEVEKSLWKKGVDSIYGSISSSCLPELLPPRLWSPIPARATHCGQELEEHGELVEQRGMQGIGLGLVETGALSCCGCFLTQKQALRFIFQN